MRIIGLIGGMSWESTVSYYKIINNVVKQQLGGLHSARCILYSVDFQEIEECQKEGRWQDSAEILGHAAKSLEAGGADFIVICTNTMHKVADAIGKQVKIPILHIGDATADVILDKGIRRIGLLGTAYTMEQDFYIERLRKKGLDVIIPGKDARHEINRVIFEELCLGEIRDESRDYFLECIRSLASQGAEGVILGCTEIGLLVQQDDTDVLLFDTAEIHAENAALYALS